MNPFEAHAKAVSQLQTVLGAGPLRTDGAVLRVNGLNVPCTHSPVIDDFNLMAGGASPKLFIEQCEFLAADVGTTRIRKGLKCTLTVKKGAVPLELQIWSGGLLPGGLMYRVSLASANYNG